MTYTVACVVHVQSCQHDCVYWYMYTYMYMHVHVCTTYVHRRHKLLCWTPGDGFLKSKPKISKTFCAPHRSCGTGTNALLAQKTQKKQKVRAVTPVFIWDTSALTSALTLPRVEQCYNLAIFALLRPFMGQAAFAKEKKTFWDSEPLSTTFVLHICYKQQNGLIGTEKHSIAPAKQRVSAYG